MQQVLSTMQALRSQKLFPCSGACAQRAVDAVADLVTGLLEGVSPGRATVKGGAHFLQALSALAKTAVVVIRRICVCGLAKSDREMWHFLLAGTIVLVFVFTDFFLGRTQLRIALLY